MNPIPIFIASLLAGLYFGWRAGYASAIEEMDSLVPESFSEIQAGLARMGLQ